MKALLVEIVEHILRSEEAGRDLGVMECLQKYDPHGLEELAMDLLRFEHV